MVAQEAWDPKVMLLQVPAGPTPPATASTLGTRSPALGSPGAKPCAFLPVGIVSSSAAGMPAGHAQAPLSSCLPRCLFPRKGSEVGEDGTWGQVLGGQVAGPGGEGADVCSSEQVGGGDGPGAAQEGHRQPRPSSACGCSAPGPQLGCCGDGVGHACLGLACDLSRRHAGFAAAARAFRAMDYSPPGPPSMGFSRQEYCITIP